MNPTEEQQAIIEAARDGGNMVIEAGAGAGKTSTLKMLAQDMPNQKGCYVAYNRAIADDAKASFPSSVQCATAHSFAFRAVGIKYKARLNGPRLKANDVANILGITDTVELTSISIPPWKLARMVIDAVKRYCYSADQNPGINHIPFVPGMEDTIGELRQFLIPYVLLAWSDIQDPNGKLKFEHDYYLKMWALTNPSLNCDYVLLDESQDANPVIAQVVESQNAQKFLVGDSAQQIYAWRGAVDAMAKFDADHRLTLSQSFRFGDAVAIEANKWLELLDAPLRLKGFDQIQSVIAPQMIDPDAILCRTNAEAMAQTMNAQEDGRRVALVGGAYEIIKFAKAARDLQMGKPSSHPELTAFANWNALKEYVNDEEDTGSLKVMVRMVESHGVDRILAVAEDTVDERHADVVVSTAHKAKGREWAKVKIASDFQPPKDGKLPSPAESRLAYVAVTRARQELDNTGLSWVDNLNAGDEKESDDA